MVWIIEARRAESCGIRSGDRRGGRLREVVVEERLHGRVHPRVGPVEVGGQLGRGVDERRHHRQVRVERGDFHGIVGERTHV